MIQKTSGNIYCRSVICVVLFLFAILNGFSQTLPPDPAVRIGSLANGFTYYIRHNGEPAHRVQLYLVNKVGSILERDDQRGLAHFMEHMSFNGTTHFPKNELVHYLQKSGVRFGADLNAYTSFDETVYQLPIPTDDPVLLKNGLQIMRDWAGNAILDQKEIDDERGVVLEEKRLGKGAGERMREKTFPVILNHSRYADRVPIGVDEVLNNFKRSAILDFYEDWYRPDLQALVVVGDINVDSMELQVKKLFSDLKNPANEKPRTKYRIPLTGSNQFISVTDKEFPYTLIQVLIKRPELVVKTMQEYFEMIRRGLFNQMLAERLSELANKPNPPFLQASADMGGFLGGLDAFTVSVVAQPGLLEKSFSEVWQLILQLKQFGFTESEFQRAKTVYLSNLESQLREKDKRNSQNLVEEYTRNFLTGEASPGIEAEYAITKDYFRTISLSEVNVLAPQYIADSNRDIVVMASQKDSASLPVEATVKGWMDSTAALKRVPYEDHVAAQSLLPGELVSGKVVSEHANDRLGITEMTLSNGLKVVLKPTDFKNDEIHFYAYSPGGTSLYPDADFQSAGNAASLIQGMGLGSFTPTDLQKVLAGRRLSVWPFIAERSEGIQGSSVPKDLETALQLTHLYFTAPRIDTALFKNIIERSATIIENRYAEPRNVFADTVAAVLGSYNVRRTGPTLEKLHQVSLDKMERIYKERFADAGDFTFFFVGSFSVDSLRPLLEKYLGSLPGNGRKEQARDLHIHIPAGQIEAIARKGREPRASVELVISGDYTYSPENNIQLTALSEILGFRIIDRLREKEGEVYSPRVNVSFDKYPASRYAFTISFGCAPANVDKLVQDVKEEIARLKKSEPPASDVTKFSSEEQRQYELHLRDNYQWLNWLSAAVENKEDPAGMLDYPQQIRQVTPASVRAAANHYLNENNFIKLVLVPETGN